MWTNGDDVNDNGEPVRLYQPIPYRARLSQGFENPTISRIGGFSFANSNDNSSSLHSFLCSKCQDPMYLLAQLYVPILQKERTSSHIQDRILQVFGCNRAQCYLSLFDDSVGINEQLCLGGGGVVLCRRLLSLPEASASALPRTSETSGMNSQALDATNDANVDSSWGNDDQPMIETDDWGVDDDANLDMQGIESMVAEMEMKSAETTSKKKPPAKQKLKPISKDEDFCLPCYELHSLQEPSRRIDDIGDDDDENVGISGSSDDKIQQMLARYMAEEDDEEILAALRGTSSSSNTRGCKNRERDERLAPQDRALLAFTDRIKRAPRQVIRYARGGMPMWSVPIQISTPYKAEKGTNQRDSNTSATYQIPKCSCGADRIFECQLLPSVLHVLDVDKYSRSQFDFKSKTVSENLDVKAAFDKGGMNWGSIAIYTCSQDCATTQGEYVIIQDSLDGKPQKMNLPSDQFAFLVQDKECLDSEDESNGSTKDDEDDDNWDDCDGDDDACSPNVTPLYHN